MRSNTKSQLNKTLQTPRQELYEPFRILRKDKITYFMSQANLTNEKEFLDSKKTLKISQAIPLKLNANGKQVNSNLNKTSTHCRQKNISASYIAPTVKDKQTKGGKAKKYLVLECYDNQDFVLCFGYPKKSGEKKEQNEIQNFDQNDRLVLISIKEIFEIKSTFAKGGQCLMDIILKNGKVKAIVPLKISFLQSKVNARAWKIILQSVMKQGSIEKLIQHQQMKQYFDRSYSWSQIVKPIQKITNNMQSQFEQQKTIDFQKIYLKQETKQSSSQMTKKKILQKLQIINPSRIPTNESHFSEKKIDFNDRQDLEDNQVQILPLKSVMQEPTKTVIIQKKNRQDISIQTEKVMINQIEQTPKKMQVLQSIMEEMKKQNGAYFAEIINLLKQERLSKTIEEQSQVEEKQLSRLRDQLKRMSEQKAQRQQQILKLVRNIKLLQQKFSMLEQNQKSKQLKYKQKQLHMQLQLNEHKKQLQNVKEMNHMIQRQLNEAYQKINVQSEQVNNMLNKNQQLEQQLANVRQKMQKLNQSISTRDQQSKYEQTIKMQEEIIQKYRIQSLLHTFEGEALHAFPSEKKYLKGQIQKYTQKTIHYTKLLYRIDLLNTTNYHKYFDDKANICLVIKLVNGRLISGFSVNPVSSSKVATQGGIICSLTEKLSFPLLEGRRAVTFDNYFLIFGNSELRLKHGELKFFTNFGIANCFYDSRGQKYTILSGNDTNREELVETYEIFEVFFK